MLASGLPRCRPFRLSQSRLYLRQDLSRFRKCCPRTAALLPGGSLPRCLRYLKYRVSSAATARLVCNICLCGHAVLRDPDVPVPVRRPRRPVRDCRARALILFQRLGNVIVTAIDEQEALLAVWNIEENIQRLLVLQLDEPQKISKLTMSIRSTWGAAAARIFRIAAYEQCLTEGLKAEMLNRERGI